MTVAYTVAELIKHIKDLPPDTEIIVDDNIQGIEFEVENNRLIFMTL